MKIKKRIEQRYVCFKRSKEGDQILMDAIATFDQITSYFPPSNNCIDLDQMVRIMTYDAYKEWSYLKQEVKVESSEKKPEEKKKIFNYDSGSYCCSDDCGCFATKIMVFDDKEGFWLCQKHYYKNFMYYLEQKDGYKLHHIEAWNGSGWELYTMGVKYRLKEDSVVCIGNTSQ